MTNIAMENHHAINGKIHYFDWAIFNSKLLVYQRVILKYIKQPLETMIYWGMSTSLGPEKTALGLLGLWAATNEAFTLLEFNLSVAPATSWLMNLFLAGEH